MISTVRKSAAVVCLTLATLGSPGCGDASASQDSRVTIRVFAASSLSDVFAEIATDFEAANSNYDVELNLAASSSLATQISEGAPADVFAPANNSLMSQLEAAEVTVSEPKHFASNSLVLAVPAGNPGGISTIEDFGRAELFLGLCAIDVPCGTLADIALDNLGIEPALDTREPNVRALVTKLAAAELDAGLVYATDVEVNQQIESVAIGPTLNSYRNTYSIASVSQSNENAAGAMAFIEFALSDVGQRILSTHGFGPA